MTSTRSLTAALALALCAAAPAFAADAGRSPLHGALPAGTHPVGFTRLSIADPTRPSRPAAGGVTSPEARARRIDVHVWYPAGAGSPIAPMTFEDAMVTHLANRPAAERSQRET